MIKNAITKILLDDSTIAGLVSDRIFPVTAPQETALPFVVVQKNSTGPTDIKDGVSPLDEVAFQVDAYATTEATLQSIMSRVRTLLDRYEGTKASLTIDSIIFENETDGRFDIGGEIFAKSQDYRARIKRS